MIELLLQVLRIKVTAQRGILSKKPQDSIAVIISCGKVVCVASPSPAVSIIVCATPCIIWKIDSISSSLCVMSSLARANRTNNFKTDSGFFTSAKLPTGFYNSYQEEYY